MESKNLKDEFKFECKNEMLDDEDYEKALGEEIESNCTFSEYVDKLELKEKSDEELLQMEKYQIIDFKNYQIQKLKAYIVSLEKEKEDLLQHFKNTTDVLLEKIKENEYKEFGERPMTAKICNDINRKQKNEPEETKQASKRCANCRKEIPAKEMITHNLECIRKFITCKACKEVVSIDKKKEHLLQWRSVEV